jgi:crossover junction endodeoxyribonuclease RuvC
VRILGLDPGSLVCGYGLLDERAGELLYVECGVLTAPQDHAMEDRLGEIARGLREVIDELKPGVVAVEDVFVHPQNPRSGLALAQARGMALAVIGLAGLAVASYPPAVVKKTVAGGGAADKGQIARMVQTLIGLKSLPRADASDALAIAITHGFTLRPTSVRLVAATIARPRADVTASAAVAGGSRGSAGARVAAAGGAVSIGSRGSAGARVTAAGGAESIVPRKRAGGRGS